MKKLALLLALLTFGAVGTRAQDGQRTFQTTVVANDIGVGNIGSAIAFHQITWNVVGSVPTCQVKLQSSADNITYADLITTQTCTSNGQSTVVGGIVNYIKIEVTTKSGLGTVVVHWNGFNAIPSGGGNISGTIANTQVAFGSAANTIAGDAQFIFGSAGKTLAVGVPDSSLTVQNWIDGSGIADRTTTNPIGIGTVVQSTTGQPEAMVGLAYSSGNGGITVTGGDFSARSTNSSGTNSLGGVDSGVIMQGSGAIGSGATGMDAFYAQTAVTAGTVGQAVGVFIDNNNTGAGLGSPGGVITEEDGIYIKNQFNANSATNFAIHLDDQSQAPNNWAIKTGLGLIEFGDTVQFDGSTIGIQCAQVANCSGPSNNSQNANQVTSGGFVEWTGNYNFTVGAAVYSISGVTYNSPLTNITLTTADPSNDRIDTIAVDNTGTVVVLTGTPAANPLAPAVDPATQLELTFVYVTAASTAPTQISRNDIYHENTEWTTVRSPASNPPWNLASTNNPYDGTVDIEATTAATGNFITLTDPFAATVDLANSNALVFYIRSKAAWPATRSITVQWYNGSTAKGSPVTLRTGAFGFNSATLGLYQQVSIPNSVFGINGVPVTTLRFTVAGSGTSIGFYLDDITLQGGATTTTLPTGIMIFRGTWSATAAYNANDVVTSGNILYVALVANTAQTPASSPSSWTQTNPASVTSVSSGNLSPLFTTSVATATTTPAISYALSNAAAFTVYGNATSSSAAPSFTLLGQPVSTSNTSGTYTIAAADRTSILSQNSAGTSAWTLPQNGSAGFTGSYFVTVCDKGAGTITVTPTTSTISSYSFGTFTSAASSLAVATGQCAIIVGNSADTNYTALVTGPASVTGTGATVQANTPTLITPVLGAATATSVLATGLIDGTGAVTATTGTSFTFGTTGTVAKREFYFNEEATAGQAVTGTLPTAAAGLYYCVANANGGAANTGALTIATSASGQFIIYTDGTLSASGGNVASGGAAADSACVVGIDSTHWFLYIQSGTWTKN